jgi:hypothetical protein
MVGNRTTPHILNNLPNPANSFVITTMTPFVRAIPSYAQIWPCAWRARRAVLPVSTYPAARAFSTTVQRQSAAQSGRAPPDPPTGGKADASISFLGTKKRLPEFSLADKVILVSGGARGLGLTQAEGLLEAGATGAES